MRPVRKMTPENCKEIFEYTRDLQLCQVRGQYVLIWFEKENGVKIIDPLKETHEKKEYLEEISEKRYENAKVELLKISTDENIEFKHSGLFVIAVAFEIAKGVNPKSLLPQFYTKHGEILDNVKQVLQGTLDNNSA